MSPLRGVRVRLSLALLAVVLGALGIVYLSVVPTLRGRLEAARITRLERDLPALVATMPAEGSLRWPDYLELAQAEADGRVVAFDALGNPPVLFPLEDSNQVTSADVQNDPVARRAATTGRPASGVVTRGGTRYAEAAMPTRREPQILLLAAPLAETGGTIDLVQRRIAVAALLALVVALAVGFGAATLFTRRIRRLERAAETIASGSFDEPVVDDQEDELGQLARSFERMRQRLAQLDHARRTFVANASHELRTPLFSLAGSLELMADEEMDADTRADFLATMRDQVERLTRLASDLLDLSRLDAGQLQLEREAVDLARVGDLLRAEFTARASREGRAVDVVHEDTPAAAGDLGRILQVGRILVDNALAHTPTPARVTILTGEREGEPFLAVADEGPGIDPDEHERVFDRFYRGAGGRAHGSGLGLAIASELAALMGGTLQLESEPGATRVTLRLAPFPRENAPAPSPPEPPVPAGG